MNGHFLTELQAHGGRIDFLLYSLLPAAGRQSACQRRGAAAQRQRMPARLLMAMRGSAVAGAAGSARKAHALWRAARAGAFAAGSSMHAFCCGCKRNVVKMAYGNG